jgi:hypothetical protein
VLSFAKQSDKSTDHVADPVAIEASALLQLRQKFKREEIADLEHAALKGANVVRTALAVSTRRALVDWILVDGKPTILAMFDPVAPLDEAWFRATPSDQEAPEAPRRRWVVLLVTLALACALVGGILIGSHAG